MSIPFGIINLHLDIKLKKAGFPPIATLMITADPLTFYFVVMDNLILMPVCDVTAKDWSDVDACEGLVMNISLVMSILQLSLFV